MNMHCLFPFFTAATIALLACSPINKSTEQPKKGPVSTLVGDICDKNIVLLGENGFHADGTTITFKVGLVESLIDQCGFNTILFEASFYDFTAIEMALQNGEMISLEHVESALGEVHNKNTEIGPLITRLVDYLNQGKVRLAGLDDQLGSRGAFYSLEEMPKALTRFLPKRDSARCEPLIRNRIWWDFPAEVQYDEVYRSHILECLSLIDTAIFEGPIKDNELAAYSIMIDNIRRYLERDFTSSKTSVSGRDQSMFLNLETYMKRASNTDKFIVWSTNTHIAKNGQGMSIYSQGGNLGSYVSQFYDDESVAIGFSALSGETRLTNGSVMPLPNKPKDALEKIVFKNTDEDIVYLDMETLKSMGNVSGALYSHKPRELNWSQSFDAVIVFRDETASVRVAN